MAESKTPPVGESSEKISVMPVEFYGGKDPVVHYKKQTIVIEDVKENKPLPTTPPKVSPPGVTPLNAKSSKKWWFIGSGVCFLGVLVIVGYYLWQAGVFGGVVETPVTPTPPVITTTVPVVTPPIIEPPTTTLPIETPTSTVDIGALPLDFPPTLSTDSADIDADSLTDIEEEIFRTDSGSYDTDSDGYNDGLEVFNLYNPQGIAPMKLVDSGLVLDYDNPTYRYRVYYPVAWNVSPVDPRAEQVLFSAINGDYIELRVVEKNIGETFEDWFARMAGGQAFTDLEKFTNRFLVEGWYRKDGGVTYFNADEVVYVVLYHPLSSSAVPFKHVMQMVRQSFRPTKTMLEIPIQPVIPTAESSVSSTDEIISTASSTADTQSILEM